MATQKHGRGPAARIHLLGGVGAVTDRGEPLDVGPAKCQAVFAALALSAGTAVPASRLVDLVWGEDPPRTAERTLQSYLTRLRKGLGPDSIIRTGAAYRLDVTPDSVDVLRFQRRIDVGDVAGALAEWTGPPLTGLDAPGFAAIVDGLTERWLGAVEANLERRVETDASGAIGPLTELTASYPFREGLWALLMTALYRTGRQADALTAYRAARRNLIEHLGVEPGPRLREVESLVLEHDERLSVAATSGPSAGIAAGRPTGTVTFGFCEVADPGRLWARNRVQMAAAMTRHDALVGAAVDRYGGQVFASGGDSIGVAFHRAADAVSWASELRAVMTGCGAESGDVEIRLRIGLHTGEATERERGYFGPAVHTAARLAAAGHGGQTLVSGATAAMIDGADLRELGTYRLEGTVTEQRVYQLGGGEHPPLPIADSRRGNLPRLGRLIGRDRDLEVVDDALAAWPVVTLVGAGGIGKTRLALAAARRVAVDDGAWMIDLAEIVSPGDVPRAVAAPLGIKESPGRTLAESVVTVLRSRRVLLVLDNCEHVVDAAAEFAQAIAEGCPDVRVLATSREGLGLRHGLERLIPVAPLEPSGPGADLFCERASAASPAFDALTSRRSVEEICRRLDGVPLAIELAAARTASLTPADLLSRLDDHLGLLVAGRRPGGERHRTLRATIQWSYDLLSPPQRLLFQRLSVFVGPFDLAAAEMVAADLACAGVVAGLDGALPVPDGAFLASDGAGVAPAGAGVAPAGAGAALDSAGVDDLLGELVQRSMLIAESGPFGQRFRLLETMRQFAAGHLAQSSDVHLVAHRHARWCVDRVTRIRRLLAGPAEAEGVARLDEHWPNLRAAFEWACTAGDGRLAYALVHPVVTEVSRRSRAELGDWIERVLTLASPGDTELVVFGLTWAAQRYKLGLDLQAWERLADKYGEPDHPLIRHARASASQDWETMARWAPPAMAELRRRGDGDHAEQFELDAVAASVFGGRFDDGDPERTHSPDKSIEAGAVFRSGDRLRAFRMLADYIDQLLDTGNIQAICVACVEFVNMMANLGRLEDAALMLSHLDSFAPYWAGLVADARSAIAAGQAPGMGQAADQGLDQHQALEYMGRVLRRLAEG